MRRGISVLADLADGGTTYPGAYPNRVYYVNNVTGSASASGLGDWDNAMDEISTAAAAWETYRATLATNNQNVRGQIYVQGTATVYSALTTAFHYCDVIGIGADPRGNGAGIVRIGADSGVSDGCDFTGTMRGVNWYNIQFQAGVGGYSFRGTNFFRCRWDNCVFATNGSPGGAPAAGFSGAIVGGCVWKDCLWLCQSSAGNGPDVGFEITSTHFHGCLVEDCYISGADAAVQIASTCVNGYNSIFKRCHFGWGDETCAIGVDDNATSGHIIFANCTVFATDAFDLANNGAGRIIGCYAANAFAT
jgi:hypothetical protein